MGLHNVTIDLCRYMKGSLQSSLLDMTIKDVKRYGNIFHQCPFTV